jgi:hypothetical protein
MDFNDADAQRDFETIPAGTIVTLDLALEPGGAGDDAWATRSKDGFSSGLKCRCTVLEPSQHAKRVIYTWLTIAGKAEGHLTAAQISRAQIRAMLESARGVRPDDQSEKAQQARRIIDYGDLDGLRFIAKLGVEPARDGYQAKNTLAEIITPERTQWHPVEQVPKQREMPQGNSKAVSAPIDRPAWAR